MLIGYLILILSSMSGIYYKMVCICDCISSGGCYIIGEIYLYREMINYKKEISDYAIYNYDRDIFLGYVDKSFINKNFMEYSFYLSELSKVDDIVCSYLFSI